MPSKKMASQVGNSCAAHCTELAIAEIKNQNPSKDNAEQSIWPDIQFVDQGGASTLLAQQKNSDPRRIVAYVEKLKNGVTAKLMCDSTQKTTAMSYVNEAMRPAVTSLFSLLTQSAVSAPILLDECAFYNCSFTMHNKSAPSAANFTGFHNILVAYSDRKSYFYNSNENNPDWQTVDDWKLLKNQNGGQSSYVFTGVAVALF